MDIYYIITNKDETYKGYKYKDGLNIIEDNNEFYFTTSEFIHKFYDLGENLRVVKLPLDNPDFKMVKLKNKFKANMIILEEKYNFNNLNDFKEIYKINTNYNNNIYNIEILEWLKSINYYFDNTDIIYNASFNGHVHILEWFKNSGYEFKYNVSTISMASHNGHVNVLEWFKNSGYKFKNYNYAIQSAIINGHVNVLDWFKKSGYNSAFQYNGYAIYLASIQGHIHILEWFKKSGYKLIYLKKLAMHIFKYNQLKVLKWFRDNNYKLKIDVKYIINQIINNFEDDDDEYKMTNIIYKNFIKWNKNYSSKITSYYLKQYKH
jgi:hypothetical protein